MGVKTLFGFRNKVVLLGSAAVMIALVCLAGYQSVFNNSESRFLTINIFSDETIARNIVEKVNTDRERSDLPQIIKPYVHNKYFEYVSLLTKSYLSNLSLNEIQNY